MLRKTREEEKLAEFKSKLKQFGLILLTAGILFLVTGIVLKITVGDNLSVISELGGFFIFSSLTSFAVAKFKK